VVFLSVNPLCKWFTPLQLIEWLRGCGVVEKYAIKLVLHKIRILRKIVSLMFNFMDMLVKTVNATDIQKRFGLWLEESHKEPVSIQKHNRNVAVLVDYEQYVFLDKLRNIFSEFQKERSKTATKVDGMPLQIQSFLSDMEVLGGMTSDDIEAFKKFSSIFKSEFSL
jgi:prevent-host-death family protein